jgi:hypothetical protein
MGRMKDFYTDTLALKDEVKSISVFTNDEHNPRTDCDLSWVVTGEGEDGHGEFIKEMSDVMAFCECSYCEKSKKEIAECVSLCDALEWVQANKPGFPVNAYVSTELLSLAKSEPEAFDKEVEGRHSCQLKVEAEKLEKLLEKMEVKIVEFSYANKDILPIFQ